MQTTGTPQREAESCYPAGIKSTESLKTPDQTHNTHHKSKNFHTQIRGMHRALGQPLYDHVFPRGLATESRGGQDILTRNRTVPWEFQIHRHLTSIRMQMVLYCT